jgi:hypothetical protein
MYIEYGISYILVTVVKSVKLMFLFISKTKKMKLNYLKLITIYHIHSVSFWVRIHSMMHIVVVHQVYRYYKVHNQLPSLEAY